MQTQTFDVKLLTAPENAIAILGFDTQASALSLDSIAMPGCTLFALPSIALGTVTDAVGKASLSIGVPSGAPVGSFFVQWLVADSAANARGLVVSNAGRITLGIP